MRNGKSPEWRTSPRDTPQMARMALTSTGGRRRSRRPTCRPPQRERPLPCTAGGSPSEPCSASSSSRAFTYDRPSRYWSPRGRRGSTTIAGRTSAQPGGRPPTTTPRGRPAPAQLGYGDGDEATVLSYGSNSSNRRITYYFRRAFTVANPAALAALTVRYVRDDGCVIYSTASRSSRSNMPSGTVTYTTRAIDRHQRRGRERVASSRRSIRRCSSPAPTSSPSKCTSSRRRAATSASISSCAQPRRRRRRRPSRLTSPANRGVSNNPAVTLQRVGGRTARARERDAVHRRPAADRRVQRTGAGGGRADHGGHADARRRRQPVDQRRRPDAARARPDEVPDARRRAAGQVPGRRRSSRRRRCR